MNQRPELLAPAGNFEKLEIAFHYGADACYLAGKDYSLRNFSGNFTIDEIEKAIDYAHSIRKKIYVTCNTFPRNDETVGIRNFIHRLSGLNPDGLIISDPGVVQIVQELAPHVSIHLSTQANTTNYQSVLFWQKQGIKRVNVARELSLTEIKEIGQKTSAEIEAFVHGAMCISYSGRCLLSSFMAGRDSNRGMCSHPCRWKYALVEELRPQEYLPFAEDEKGSYIFNSKDLCMIDHIPELINSGVHTLKIEGRMKGINYVAAVVKVYREAIDQYFENPKTYKTKDAWKKELGDVSHRPYSTGFYFNKPEEVIPTYQKSAPFPGNKIVGKVLKSMANNQAQVHVRNKIFQGDKVEVLSAKGALKLDQIHKIIDQHGNPLEFAQPTSTCVIQLSFPFHTNDLIRKI